MKSTSFRSLALGAVVLGLGQSTAYAQFDATVEDIIVTQGMQTGSTPLTGQRSTYLRASIGLNNPPSVPVALDGILRVFVDGVEVPESPIYSINGPFPAQEPVNLNNEDGTLNFYYLPPISNNVAFQVEVNPAGPNFVAEGNTANNTRFAGPFRFYERNVPEFAYSPIDYRPGGGGTPNPPDPDLIKPSSGDGFIQGIIPVADLYYHRTDAEAKLWTGNLSGSGSSLLNSLEVDIAMMNPVPDFLYGWVPGGLPYNGVSKLNNPVSMGNTQTFKFQRTYAHEIGHNVGRSHVSWLINEVGIDVENHLNVTETLGTIKLSNLNDIMVAGLNTNQAWVRDTNYEYFWNHPTFANVAPDVGNEGPGTLVTGIWNRKTGEVELSHVLEVPVGEATLPVADNEAEFVLRTWRGQQPPASLALLGNSTRDSCGDREHASDSPVEVDEITFSAFLPNGAEPIDRLELAPANGVDAATISLQRSAAPSTSFVFPAADGDVSGNGKITVQWTGVDPDGDQLLYYLRFSHDGERFIPLATGITETQWTVDLTKLPRLVDGQGFFELRASDGLNTTIEATSTLKGSNTFFADAGAPPWVEVRTPDSGFSYNKGTTVFLHSSGWDLEDRALGDAAISWSSDLDGVVATGRMTSVATLSVGTHVLTATATDSDLMTSTATTTITIVDRDLPDTGGPIVYCTAGTSAAGCVASISANGTPSATAASGFTLDCASVQGQKSGQFFFGTNGQQASPWGSGTSFQCVVPPTLRGGILAASGTVGACDGAFSQDMNARWQAQPGQNPGAGAVVQAQFWYRDPANTSNQTTSLSDAVEFTVAP